MFTRIKPEVQVRAREIKIDFFEEDVDVPERPAVKLLFEVKRHHLA